jgi:hypothetical protein
MAGAAYSGNMIMILSRNFTGGLCNRNRVIIAMPEHRKENLQRMDLCRYNGKWREYQVSGIHQGPAALRPGTGTVRGIFPEKVVYQV